MPDLGKLIEYNTSCSPAFVQHAGVGGDHAGRADGRAHARALPPRARLPRRRARARCPASRSRAPAGAMYAFFRVDGLDRQPRVLQAPRARGAARASRPGSAFGPEGEGFVRWCFASDEARLADGVARLGGVHEGESPLTRPVGHSLRSRLGEAMCLCCRSCLGRSATRPSGLTRWRSRASLAPPSRRKRGEGRGEGCAT